MTLEQNIFVAKRNIVDYIWKSAHLEGLSVTYLDTDAIYNGMSGTNIPVAEIIAVNNLKHAWQFVLENTDYPCDYPFICRINKLIGGDTLIINAGFIRKVPVSIGGTTWQPGMPIESQIKEELSDVLGIVNPTERGITLMLYIMRKQMFLDGNKRTAQIAANHVMITSGSGVLSIPIVEQPKFLKLLEQFYESGNMEEIKEFVYDKCIDGIEFGQE
jgi:Fic family protein